MPSERQGVGTPQDFDADDSWLDDRGLDCCAVCDKILGSESGHHGEVFLQDGTRYEYFLDTDPMDAPFFCPDCWPDVRAAGRAAENESLDAYAITQEDCVE